MTAVTMKELLEAGVHFGHQTKRWNPKMREYIFGQRNGIYIINLQKTLIKFREALEFVQRASTRGGTILFAGTKRQAQEAIAEEANRVGMPFVNQRWLGGTLTNYRTIKKRIERLRWLENFLENPVEGRYSKKELLQLEKERVKLAKLTPNENSEPAISGGYLLAWDVGEGNYLSRWKSIQVKYPSHPSREQKAWIERAFTEFDQALKSKDARDPIKGYAAHIEIDDWVNYILFEELVFNLDGYTRSFYLQKDRGGKIRPGPVWDHDLGLGHQFPPSTSFTQWWFTQVGTHGWITRLMDDSAFFR